jgi:arginine decarboxylase
VSANDNPDHLNPLLHQVKHWGQGYFAINTQGDLEVHTHRHPSLFSNTLEDADITPPAKVALKLHALAKDLQKQGLRFPMLVRFLDIICDRIAHVQKGFMHAITQHQYPGNFHIAYPIKVNQNKQVVETVMSTQAHSPKGFTIGLEAGSKPELMAALASATPGTLLICNGYKDKQFMKLALMGKTLGLKPIIVIEKLSECPLVNAAANELNIPATLGVRVRLHNMGAGNWQNTGGQKSKFGLNALQLEQLLQTLKQNQQLSQLQLLHLHMGSQISDLEDIETCIKEACRYFVELHKLGAPLRYFDIGGGLGIDYQGSGSDDYFSMNYSVKQYADVIVRNIFQHCQKADITPPEIIIESGRALTAHHAMIMTNIVEQERRFWYAQGDAPLSAGPVDPESERLRQASQNLQDIAQADTLIDHCYQQLDKLEQRFLVGELSLHDKAEAERLLFSAFRHLQEFYLHHAPMHPHAEALNELLTDKVFMNLSVFQSLPDAWGIDQVFPILPLQHAADSNTRPAKLYDLTCDSDGRIENYCGPTQITTTFALPVADQNPLLGIFLVGAYQEILGDIHNLFGKTDAADVVLTDDHCYQIVNLQPGDSVSSVLAKVYYDAEQLHQSVQDKMRDSDITEDQMQAFEELLTTGLQGYTYWMAEADD